MATTLLASEAIGRPAWKTFPGLSPRLRAGLSGGLPLLVIVVAWQAASASRLWPSQVLTPPLVVLATFGDLLAEGELQRHLGASLYRLLIGFAWGAAIGLGVGTIMALSRWANRMIGPLFHAVRQAPIIAFIPLLILLFDVQDAFKIVAAAAAVFFPVTLATLDGIRGVPKSYFEVAALYRMPWPRLVTRVLAPAALPSVLTGMRLGLMRGWLVLVAAELMAADSGIGQMMEMGRQLFRIDVVMVGVIVTGVVGFVLDRSVLAVEAWSGRWRSA